MSAGGQAPADHGQPVCPRHPQTISYVRCQRCERPTCPYCQVPAPVGVLCIDCDTAARREFQHSRTALGVRRGTQPMVTYGLIAANVAFFLVGVGGGMGTWLGQFGLIPVLTWSEPWRLVTSGFVHLGVLHLAINMFMLFQFGTQLERVIGSARFGALYAISLLGGSLAVQFLSGPTTVTGGASGAIFGLFAAFGVLLYKLKLQWQSIAAQAALWIVAGLFLTSISWQGHLGGAIAGLIAGYVIITLQQRGAQR